MALIRIMEKILFKMNHDELKGLVFVDFRKGFNLIDHNLSLKKLLVYSASPDSVAWFQYIVTRWVMTVCENRAYNIQSQNLSSGKGYCRDQSSVQFYFSYLWMICLYIWTTTTTDIYTPAIPPCSWVQTGMISLLQLKLFLMIWRISRNGQLKTQCTSIPRRPKHYLLPEKGYNISFMWKQQAYNYALMPQISHHKLQGLI